MTVSVNRRSFIKIGSMAAATLAAAGCAPAGRALQGQARPPSLEVDTGAGSVVLRRLLNRAGYGPTPESLAHAQAIGFEACLEEQLAPETLDDTRADLFVRNLHLVHLDEGALLLHDHRDIFFELALAAFLRALHSRRQLYEAMVEFWSDHFTIYPLKDKSLPRLKVIDDREVIRPHALGKFRDLLQASAHSPAMLAYLDNTSNLKDAPNENYARELMELHTLGIGAGYTQKDVQELARALTGWGVAAKGRTEGRFSFNSDQHDFGPKTILGQELPAGRGEAEVTDLLDMFAGHPATAAFISRKLVRRFVADDPPAGLVEEAARTFIQTDGDIRAVLRVIFLSADFAAAPPKIKRPFTYVVSSLRGLSATVGGHRAHKALGDWLGQMGQVPFNWPMPDGYPDITTAWLGTLLPRWNFAFALTSGTLDGLGFPLEALMQTGEASTPEDALAFFHRLLTGAPPNPELTAALQAHLTPDMRLGPSQEVLRAALAVVLAGPDFQYV